MLNVIDWFQNALTVVYPDSKFQGIEFELEQNTELKVVFEDLLKYFDTGISGIQLTEIEFDKADIPSTIKNSIKTNLLKDKSEKTNLFLDNLEENIRYIFFKDNYSVKVKKMMTEHTVYGENAHRIPFDLNEESDGTQRIMDFVPLLIDLFKGDNVYIVDEMERSLHPNLVYDLIDLFIKKSTNINSQLILASHEASLFDKNLLRKDEIWFTNKSEFGATKLYSLQDYNVNIDDKSRKDYLLGRFKAVPRLGNRSSISFIEDLKDAKRKN